MRKIMTIAAAAAVILGFVGPARALDQPGDFNARFYGTCTNNYVAYWRTEAPAGVDPKSFAPDDVSIVIKNVDVKDNVMYPGDYAELHRYFANNGVPKTIQVYVDNTLAAEHTYPCGFYSRAR